MAGRQHPVLVQKNRVLLNVQINDSMSARNYLLNLGIGRREVHAIFEEKRLVCQGEVLKRNDLVAPGMTLELTLACDVQHTCLPSGQLPACRVIYEDGIVLACDKQAGVLVHSDGGDALTLSDAVQAHLTRQGIYRRAQAVQRIDVATTGLVLFSTAREFQTALDEQVASGSMHKRYLAVVQGSPSWKTRHITAAIGRDRHHAQRMRVCAPGQGKMASTKVRVLAQHNGLTLLEAELETGRRHQIRVHLASVGCPILGDALYGGASGNEPLMLHAWCEGFVHPFTHEPLTIRTAWPERFKHLGFYEDCFV